ncbi:MAG: DUF3786 domain-containing protein [Desulfamplus sp.]|nr:DUF3786 domain-containing protein [Desulfamplus sp.]
MTEEKYPVDSMNFKELAGLNPEDVCKQALCRYDEIKKSYTISVWGDRYEIFLDELKIESLSSSSSKKQHDYFYVFLVNYLIQAKDANLCNEWISEKDIAGGSTFFRGPHEIPTRFIASSYSQNIEKFKIVCEELGGTPINMADAAYSFAITPRILIAVLFWDKDDDFPADAKILFDRSISQQLALDTIFALAVAICSRLGKKGQK